MTQLFADNNKESVLKINHSNLGEKRYEEEMEKFQENELEP